jgi:hypothetical protein
MVVASNPLTARVAPNPVLAAAGFHRTVKPGVKAVAAGDSVTVCACADPPPAAYQFTLVSEVPIRDLAAVVEFPVLFPQK